VNSKTKLDTSGLNHLTISERSSVYRYVGAPLLPEEHIYCIFGLDPDIWSVGFF